MTFAVFYLGALADCSGQTASIESLGWADPVHRSSSGEGVSADGTAIVGSASTPTGTTAFVWRTVGGLTALGTLNGFAAGSEGYGVSGDGSVAVGRSFTNAGAYRAFRWSSDGGMEDLGTLGGTVGDSEAFGVSVDGSVVVGYSSNADGRQRAFRWTSNGGMVDLGTIANTASAQSKARAVSADGSVVVGNSGTNTAAFARAFRWTAAGGMQDLGALAGAAASSYAQGVSSDGRFVVGYSNTQSPYSRAFLWGTTSGIRNLGTVANSNGDSLAYGVSADGRTVVGESANGRLDGGLACVWIDGVPRQLWNLLESDYGVDLTALGWRELDRVTACSPDGTTLTGYGRFGLYPTAFRVVLPRINDRPVLSDAVPDGSTQIAAEGAKFTRGFSAWDPNADPLTLEVDGLPPGATLTPPAGTTAPATEASPFSATLEWTPGPADVGSSHDVTIAYRDDFGGVTGRTFSIDVRSNEAPVAAPIEPKTVECIDGQHRVRLSTVVEDLDGDALAIVWKVNGEAKKRQSNVADGSTVSFDFDYQHGATAVTLEVGDGFVTTDVGTTVTVVDTQNPLIVAARNVVVPTDQGKAFATGVALPRPVASDGSGHPVTLTSDARSTYPLGVTVVTWTATDEVGHQATASQKVTVVDQEKPNVAALPALRKFCDPGKVFATVKLAPPKATDNVAVVGSVTTTVGSRFRIGTTNVVWTAKDAAGNVSTSTQKVTVVNRKPRAIAGRDLVVTTRSENGVRVTLDGSASSDPDKHALRFRWSAPGVKLNGATGAKATGLFPIGTKNVTLIVTDAGGLKHKDVVKVTVKLKNGRRRPRGADANRSFAAASQAASEASPSLSPSSAEGRAYAALAASLGDAAGEFVRWEDGQSQGEAELVYAGLRAAQGAYGGAAVRSLVAAYIETGDPTLLTAARYAAYGTAYAESDLKE